MSSIRGTILLKAGLELDCTNCAGAADMKDLNNSDVNFRESDNLSDLRGQVMHVSMSAGLYLNRTLVNHGLA